MRDEGTILSQEENLSTNYFIVSNNTSVLFKFVQLITGSSHIVDSGANKYQRITVVINYCSAYLNDYIAKKSFNFLPFSRIKLPGFSFLNTLSGPCTYFHQSSGCVGGGSQLMTNFDAKMKS